MEVERLVGANAVVFIEVCGDVLDEVLAVGDFVAVQALVFERLVEAFDDAVGVWRVVPSDARYGNGQYLSDVRPGTMSCAQLSRCFIGQPFQGSRFTNYVEINVDGLNVIQGRTGVFVVPGETPLDLTGRIVSSGAN